MVFPRYPQNPEGIYSEQDKETLVVIMEKASVSDAVNYLKEHAVVHPSNDSRLDYISGKIDQELDIIQVGEKIDVLYANQSSIKKYYYALRIASFQAL